MTKRPRNTAVIILLIFMPGLDEVLYTVIEPMITFIFLFIYFLLQGIISAVAGFFTGKVSKIYQDSQRELFHSSVLLTLALLGLTLAPSLTLLLACLIPLCVSSAVIRVSSSAITIGRCEPDKVRDFCHL